MKKLKKYLFNNLLAFDRQVNALMGGDPEMTISGRMGVAISEGRCWLCYPICRALHWLDNDHCHRAARAEAREGSDEVTRL